MTPEKQKILDLLGEIESKVIKGSKQDNKLQKAKAVVLATFEMADDITQKDYEKIEETITNLRAKLKSFKDQPIFPAGGFIKNEL